MNRQMLQDKILIWKMDYQVQIMRMKRVKRVKRMKDALLRKKLM